MFARTARADQGAQIVTQLGLEQPLDRRPHAIDDRPQVPRLVLRRPLQRFERRQNRAALRMAEHDDEPRAVALGGELDAADLRRRDDVAGDADDEEIAEALIEHDLGRHARVGTSEDDGERRLPRGQLDAPCLAGERSEADDVRREPMVACLQAFERFVP